MINGIINVYKEKGYTSHDVVAKMRGILKIKKIGHTGTLDPDAQGVLPVCIGKATKLVDMITDKDKTYEAVCKLGITTDTQDITGKVLTTAQVNVTYEQIEEVIKSYIGEYLQLPPMYSAIKVDGKKLYELARQGKEIDRERRKVIIKDIRILDYSKEDNEVKVSVDCGKGTYIRTLLHDIGETLGCGGTMKSLIRTAVGNFMAEEALKLSEIEELVHEDRLEPYVVTVDQIFEVYSKLSVDREYHKLIYNGNSFRKEHLSEPMNEVTTELIRIYDAEDTFIGIYRFDTEDNLYKPVKMFL
ncbi:MAG: truB [Herbinix sp.]|nr:truB [Herbinix sp.]